ncbi:MAG: Sec-independent protein translocase subunit TatA/TatB [Acidimicrobiales bacterium]
MGDLSPIKILIVVVVALMVLGPERLPEMTRKAGKAWGDFRKFRDNMESEVRGVVGDVPGLSELRNLPGLGSGLRAGLRSGPRGVAAAAIGVAATASRSSPDEAPSGADGPSLAGGGPGPGPPPRRGSPVPGAPPPADLFSPDDPSFN